MTKTVTSVNPVSKLLTREEVENLAATWLGRETNLSTDYCASSAREFAAVLFGK